MHDLRDAYRALRAAPSVFLFVVLSLGLAIGANTAIFALVDNLLLKRLPVQDPEGLAVITRGRQGGNYWATYPAWEHIRDLQLFEEVFAWSLERFEVGSQDDAQPADAIVATSDFFDVLSLPAALGRTFEASDERELPVVVLSHGFWRRRYGGSPEALGRTLSIEGTPFAIIGVTPEDFFGLDVGRRFDVAIPIWTEPLIHDALSRVESPYAQWLRIMGRLRPAQLLEETQVALRHAQPQIREATVPDYAFAPARERYLSIPLEVVSAQSGTSGLRGAAIEMRSSS